MKECTSKNFQDLLAVSDGKHSWIARMHRLEGKVSGLYAGKVFGEVSVLSVRTLYPLSFPSLSLSFFLVPVSINLKVLILECLLHDISILEHVKILVVDV